VRDATSRRRMSRQTNRADLRVLDCEFPALEKRYAVQPTVPGDAGEENDSDLTSVEKSCAQIPTGGFRKLAAGEDPFPNKEKRRSFRQSESREDSCWPPLRLKISQCAERIVRSAGNQRIASYDRT